MSPIDNSNRFTQLVLWIFFIVVLRIVVVWFNNIDLYVDEVQYWFWGQNLDFGYYSKPPLIGWLLRAITDLAQSSSRFWLRLPAPILHGVTAFLLFQWIRREQGDRIGFWTAITYLSLPLITIGSSVISTDTVMMPFFALTLLFYWRMLSSGRVKFAVLAGLSIGLSFLAKYAAIYFFLGVAVSAIFNARKRPSLLLTSFLVFTFLLTISPNLIWNIFNEFTTVKHTASNIGWINSSLIAFELKFVEMFKFLASQFAVIGPILGGVLLIAIFSRRSDTEFSQLLFFVPVIIVVTLQALLSNANANWAAAAYLTATPFVVSWLLNRNYLKILKLAVTVNFVLCIVLALLIIWPNYYKQNDGSPFMFRYLGRHTLSANIISTADVLGINHIVASKSEYISRPFLHK